MNPLTIFPQLLFLGPGISPLLLRIVVSIFIFYLAKQRKGKEFSWTFLVYSLVGGLLFLGIYAQVAAILGIILIKFDFYVDYWRNRKTNTISTEKYLLYFLAGVILMSLLFTGPGAFAFDRPL